MGAHLSKSKPCWLLGGPEEGSNDARVVIEGFCDGALVLTLGTKEEIELGCPLCTAEGPTDGRGLLGDADGLKLG